MEKGKGEGKRKWGREEGRGKGKGKGEGKKLMTNFKIWHIFTAAVLDWEK
jgi:hypothetical protein